MNGWKMCAVGWMVYLLTGLLTSCAPAAVKHNAALCSIHFELADPALADLSVANLRAVAAFEAACGRIQLP